MFRCGTLYSKGPGLVRTGTWMGLQEGSRGQGVGSLQGKGKANSSFIKSEMHHSCVSSFCHGI
jgi:hypothetical protein